MSEPKDLLLLVEQLRRSNRRWKVLAMVACSILLLAVLASYVNVARERMRAEAALRDANAALARAQVAANLGQVR
jgi:hypothetical protein